VTFVGRGSVRERVISREVGESHFQLDRPTLDVVASQPAGDLLDEVHQPRPQDLRVGEGRLVGEHTVRRDRARINAVGAFAEMQTGCTEVPSQLVTVEKVIAGHPCRDLQRGATRFWDHHPNQVANLVIPSPRRNWWSPVRVILSGAPLHRQSRR
jgi:hypothetical protein